MKVEYNGGKMIVTHPTGIVNKYTVTDIEIQKEAVKAEIQESKEELKYLDECIKLILASTPKLSLFTRLRNRFTRRA